MFIIFHRTNKKTVDDISLHAYVEITLSENRIFRIDAILRHPVSNLLQACPEGACSGSAQRRTIRARESQNVWNLILPSFVKS